jgi:release factor glutamine methyltransferase
MNPAQAEPVEARAAHETVAASLRAAATTLAAVSDTPRLDGELLMAAALGVTRSDLLIRHATSPVPAGFADRLARRLRHEPVAQIVGVQEFYGLEFTVTPDVLIPRGDSETLIEAARARLAASPPARILDLGTGSGALLCAALHVWAEAQGIGTDRSPAALAVAATNVGRLGFTERAKVLHADWDQPGWADNMGQFALILANPPYVEDDALLARQVRDYEPAGALFAGALGLDAYAALIPQLPDLLAPDGIALVEIGATQAAAVTALAEAAGLSATLHRDLGGRPRALELAKSSRKK